jgi:beta-glucosidase/6-phospho-beta-glucosidase/beta-galactosidase
MKENLIQKHNCNDFMGINYFTFKSTNLTIQNEPAENSKHIVSKNLKDL